MGREGITPEDPGTAVTRGLDVELRRGRRVTRDSGHADRGRGFPQKLRGAASIDCETGNAVTASLGASGRGGFVGEPVRQFREGAAAVTDRVLLRDVQLGERAAVVFEDRVVPEAAVAPG
jgi:hypothetical protein